MNNLTNEFDNLIELIKESEEYIEYERLKKLVSGNSDINRLSSEIKTIQKEIVGLEYSGKDIFKKSVGLNSKNVELKNIPLYNDYIDAQSRLNSLLLIVKEKFDVFISELVLE
jgi:cell fate (sporulation/competence/biofilm development) regulator YmcA (YheA/YmcA/DUF963 family)